MFKRALVSVSDKTGLVEFLKPLAAAGCEIVSTGGTSNHLRDNGIAVIEVAEVTGFPEVMDGRVRTLHPKIHMGLLARSFVPEDMALLKKEGVQPFDLVVVNLYPFEESHKKGLRGAELVEYIDIGGPSLLRGAAKSFERVTVVSDPRDYAFVASNAEALTEIKSPKGLKLRHELAAKVYGHTAYYDSVVSRALFQELGLNQDQGAFTKIVEKSANLQGATTSVGVGAKPESQIRPDAPTKSSTLTLGYREFSSLRYGENPHQKAQWLVDPLAGPLSLTNAKTLQGKELSYNNILDLEAAVSAVSDFQDEPACVIVKHNTPCGVALGKTIEDAYQRAFDGDSVSAFGGIVALNLPVSAELARKLVGPFLECVIAPDVSPEALGILASKKNLRVLTLPALARATQSAAGGNATKDLDFEFKGLRGALLTQDADAPEEWSAQFKITGTTPTSEIQRDMIFAQKVVRHVKSNAIVVARHGQTVGICGGQTNRVDSVRMALTRAKSTAGAENQQWVLASDAFFPFRDSVDLAASAGVKWIIQPGGSLRDAEVEAAVLEHGLGMVVTGRRHFKH